MPIVTLTKAERDYALSLALKRQTENLSLGRRDAYGFSGANGLLLHQHGVLCEFATAKGLRIQFRETTLGAPDIGRDIQVRGATRHHYGLIVHNEDPDHHRFVLTTHEQGSDEFHIRGWFYGRECKEPRFWRTSTGRPAFFVPQRLLHPIKTLVLEAIPVIETS